MDQRSPNCVMSMEKWRNQLHFCVIRGLVRYTRLHIEVSPEGGGRGVVECYKLLVKDPPERAPVPPLERVKSEIL